MRAVGLVGVMGGVIRIALAGCGSDSTTTTTTAAALGSGSASTTASTSSLSATTSSGIGDSAYTFVSKGTTGGAGIVVVKGSDYFSIVCAGATASVAAATRLAQIALGRL